MGRRAGGTGGTNRGGATAHGTRRRERRGRVGNPPYGTTGTRGRAQGDDTRRAQGDARFCVSTGRWWVVRDA